MQSLLQFNVRRGWSNCRQGVCEQLLCISSLIVLGITHSEAAFKVRKRCIDLDDTASFRTLIDSNYDTIGDTTCGHT
jgi:hypothetical protein